MGVKIMEFMLNGWIYFKKTKNYYRQNNVTGKCEKISEITYNINYERFSKWYKSIVLV